MRTFCCASFVILFVVAALPAADSREIADAAFDELINRDFAALAKRFSPEMSAAMPSEKLSAAIGTVFKSLGTLRSGRPEPQATSSQGYDVFLYPAEFQKAKMTVVISINSEGQVGGLFLRPPVAEPETSAADANAAGEVATIKPNRSGQQNRRIQINQQIRATNVSLKDLIKFFYDVHEKQIEGGPGWMDTDRFDIVVQPAAEGKISPAQGRTMIRKLIVEWFNLTFHREEREVPVYTITVDESGPKMAEGDPNGPGDPDFNGLGNMKAKAMNMDELAGVLQGVVLDRPVLNRTGLSGKYVFTLVWAPDESQFAGVPQRPSPQAFAGRDDLFSAMREQLGLRLEAVEAPVEMLIIDQADKPAVN